MKIFIFSFLVVVSGFLSGCSTVTLADRQIDDLASESAKCSNFGRADIERRIDASRVGKKYSQGRVAHQFLEFAVAAESAYPESDSKGNYYESVRRGTASGFLLENLPESGWTKFERIPGPHGLSMDRYINNSAADNYRVLVAIRGTERSWSDWWFGNLVWISQFFSGEDQYTDARLAFQKIWAEAQRDARGRPLYFYVTGHSLGGGLARHIASAYPCVTAIVFDTSFVTQEATLSPRIDGGLVVDIVERDDELRRLGEFFGFAFDRESAYLRYITNTNSFSTGLQHSLTPMTMGMARIAATCIAGKDKDEYWDCHGDKNGKSARHAKDFYCDSKYQKDHPDIYACPH